jgi:hypothetical protein
MSDEQMFDESVYSSVPLTILLSIFINGYVSGIPDALRLEEC